VELTEWGWDGRVCPPPPLFLSTNDRHTHTHTQTPQRNDRGRKITVGNLGDGAAILCRSGKAVPLSTAQTPGRPDETARIERANGWVGRWGGGVGVGE
jgi:serine/threonine protein phosphatase PrpC